MKTLFHLMLLLAFVLPLFLRGVFWVAVNHAQVALSSTRDRREAGRRFPRGRGTLQQSLSRALACLVHDGVLVCERGRENTYRLNGMHAAVKALRAQNKAGNR